MGEQGQHHEALERAAEAGRGQQVPGHGGLTPGTEPGVTAGAKGRGGAAGHGGGPLPTWQAACRQGRGAWAWVLGWRQQGRATARGGMHGCLRRFGSSHCVNRRAASDRKDRQVWGVEIQFLLGRLGYQELPGPADLSGRRLDTRVWAQACLGPGRLGGDTQMDSREALGLGEVTWGAGAEEAEQGSQRARVRGGRQGGTTRMCPGETVTREPAKSSGSRQHGGLLSGRGCEWAGSSASAAKRPAFPLSVIGWEILGWGWGGCL